MWEVVFVCMFVCLGVCEYVFFCVCVCKMEENAYLHQGASLDLYLYTYMFVYVLHVYIEIYIYTYLYTYYICILKYTYVCTNTDEYQLINTVCRKAQHGGHKEEHIYIMYACTCIYAYQHGEASLPWNRSRGTRWRPQRRGIYIYIHIYMYAYIIYAYINACMRTNKVGHHFV